MRSLGRWFDAALAVAMALCLTPVLVQAAMPEVERTVLPLSEPPFEGVIGKTYKESKEAWPKLPTPPTGAPNVVVIMLDDVGFGQTSTFGGSIPTPELDKLASRGIRYNRFHTTAICSPTRAALLTGRNHHNAGFGFLVEWATGFPSYNANIPKSTATVGTILRENGYSTSWFGKNHNTPDWETSVAGPFDRWPTHMGFDYFYGFHAGETHQYYPVLFENTTPVEPSKSPEEGYHFMTDMTDKAINWMRYTKSVAPQKPIFMYFAPGAMHAPHHVAAEWRDKFKGKFDHGWDKEREIVLQRQIEMGIVPPGTALAPRIEDVAQWDSLSADEKRFFNRLMENYAGFFAFTDHEIGRLLSAIRDLPDADNTLIFYIVGDNGASSEGGMQGTINEVKSLSGFQTPIQENLAKIDHIGNPETEPHYPVGWAMAGNTPFPWVKQVASHFGGTRNPLVVVWPERIQPDKKMRSQFLHVIDVAPTILDAVGLPVPKVVSGVEQKPMDGVSFLATFSDADAPEVRTRQYFEVFSNRGIYDNGWYACTQHTLPWRQDYAPGNWDKDKWELYKLSEDFSLANDLAEKHPEKLKQMKILFEQEAEKYNVYPLDDRGTGRLISAKPAPGGSDPNRTHFTYFSGASRLAETASPNTKNKSHTITASIEMPEQGGEGVLVAAGGLSAGFSFYVQEGKLVYEYNWFDDERYVVTSGEVLPPGTVVVKMDFAYDGDGAGKGGTATLYVNGKEVGKGRIEKTVAGRFGIDTFGVGVDTGSSVSNSYKPPFAFNGRINNVDIELK